MEMEQVEVPADLKDEVMNAIFQKSPRLEKSKKRWFWNYGVVAALVPLLFISVVWNIVLLKEKGAAPSVSSSQVVSLMPLKPAAVEFESTKGMACILQQGDRRKLVVYLYGLPANKGNEAYQVWMIKDGQRSNAGTFRVKVDGFGVLSLDMRPQEQFDAIGVTLEPDDAGTAPRGSKVVGT